jgi:hypothetical protein
MMAAEQQGRSPSSSHKKDELFESTRKELDSQYAYNILLHPGHVLLLTSMPLFAGALVEYKYKAPMQSVLVHESLPRVVNSVAVTTTSDFSSSAKVNGNPRMVLESAFATASSSPGVSHAEEMTQDEAFGLARRLAVRAFRIATLGTVATFSMVGAVGFYASGCETVDEAVQGTRAWASSLLRSLKDSCGIDERPFKDVEATSGLSEHQQVQKYP